MSIIVLEHGRGWDKYAYDNNVCTNYWDEDEKQTDDEGVVHNGCFTDPISQECLPNRVVQTPNTRKCYDPKHLSTAFKTRPSDPINRKPYTVHQRNIVHRAADEETEPLPDVNQLFRQAAVEGDVDAIEDLLQNAQVDPSADDNAAIRYASANGHLDVVARLLQDVHVDPSANGNYAIRYVSANGHLDVVERLLQDVRVNLSDDNYAIRFASENGHFPVVERLLQDGRVDPSADDNAAIGSNNVVELCNTQWLGRKVIAGGVSSHKSSSRHATGVAALRRWRNRACRGQHAHRDAEFPAGIQRNGRLLKLTSVVWPAYHRRARRARGRQR